VPAAARRGHREKKGEPMRTVATVLAVLLLLAGCTAGGGLAELAPRPASALAASVAAAYPVIVRNPRFDDHNPHEWEQRAPWAYQVHGTDVSRYQEEIDWKKARDSGISFVFIKATEGGDMLDPMFENHWRGATRAGIPRSAYHFFYFCRPAIEQAQWFIRNVPRDRTAMPQVLDVEWNHLSPTCRLRPPADEVQREMRIFLEALERHYGKRPIIYTTIDFYRDNRLHEFRGYDWWLRSVAAHPTARYPGERYLFWQYTGTGDVPGIRGKADINVFNGTVADWQKWLRENAR
jgi:lysozyme